MIKLTPRGAYCQLGVMVLLLLPACATPAEWQVQTDLQVRSSYTDNVTLAPAAQAHSGWIAELLPAIGIRHDSPRLQLALDYALDLRRHSGEGQRSSQQLDSSLHLQALPDWVSFDAASTISQQSISPFGPQSNDARLLPANRRSVRSTMLSPALRHRFPALASVELVYRRQRVSSGALYDVSRQDSSLLLSGDHTGPGWNWSVAAERGVVDDPVLPVVHSARTALTISDAVNKQLALLATAGRESLDYQATGAAPEGRFRTLGLDWTPTPRSRIKASAGRRYFGHTYNLAAEYRWRHLYWTLNFDEDISTSHGEYLRIAPAGLSDFLDQLWTSRIPDLSARQQAIKVFLLISQMLGPDGRVNFLSHRYYLQKSWRMAGVYASPRSTLGLSLLSTHRTAQTSSAIDSPIIGPDQLELEDRTRQQAAQLGWSWRLSGQENLSAGMSVQNTASLQTGRRDRNTGLTLAYTRQLGRDTSVSIDLRHLRHHSNAAAPYRENGVGAAITIGF